MLAWVFSCKFAAYFQNTFSQEHLWKTAYELKHFNLNEHVRTFTSSIVMLVIPLMASQRFNRTEAVAQRCFEKKVLLEISLNSQENTCARVPF